MAKKKSAILEAAHESAQDLYEIGVISKITMREFDILCLMPVERIPPEQIKQIREHSQMSQAVFAAILNTSVSTVQKWEIGAKRPSGLALKLLSLVKSHGIDFLIGTAPDTNNGYP